MKKFLQFAGLIGAVLAIVAFILMMATNALTYTSGSTTTFVAGSRAIFGGSVETLLGTVNYKPAATALIAWILVLVAMLVLLVINVLPLLKVKALDGISGLLNLIAVGALVVGGILLFFTKGAYNAANASQVGNTTVYYFDDYALGAGYVFAAILAILGGAVAFMPVLMKLVGKK